MRALAINRICGQLCGYAPAQALEMVVRRALAPGAENSGAIFRMQINDLPHCDCSMTSVMARNALSGAAVEFPLHAGCGFWRG